MKHMHYSEVPLERVEGYDGVTVRWLIAREDGAPGFAMRLFEVAPGGVTEWHRHEWEHEVYILKGSGIVMTEGGEKSFGTGDFFLIGPKERHQFRNTAREILRFLCLVPLEAQPSTSSE